MESIQAIQARWSGPSLRENGLFKPEIRERTVKRALSNILSLHIDVLMILFSNRQNGEKWTDM